MSTRYAIAELKIDAIEAAAYAVAEAIREEHRAIQERDDHLTALVNALVGTPNPLAKPLKDGTQPAHSATSAKEVAEQDETYRTLEVARREAETARVIAWAKYEQAKLAARLAVAATEAP